MVDIKMSDLTMNNIFGKVLERATKEFVDIIEWSQGSSDTIVHKFERFNNEIKYGAKLIVRESQVAVFVNEGKIADVFQAGTYTLETKNMPIMTTLQSWKYGFESPFKAEVYFVNMTTFTNCKWGTKNPIMLRDPEFGPVRIRAFGNYALKVKDPANLVKTVSGVQGKFTIDGINEQLRNMIVTRFTDIIGESKIPVLDLAANYNELGDFIKNKISSEFLNYGFEIVDLLIDNISLPPQVEEALDKRTSMGVIGNLNAYTQFQAANAMEIAAKNPGSDAASGMGMGMGMAMAGQMFQAFSQQNNANNNFSNQVAPPPMNNQVEKFYVYINNQQSGPFDIAGLKNLVVEGKVNTDSMMWKAGMSGWKPAKEIDSISSIFVQDAPPPLAVDAPPAPPTPPVPPVVPQVSYYLIVNGTQEGPHNLDKIKELVSSNKANKDTLAWKQGMSNWLALNQIEELSSVLLDSVPPAPPTPPVPPSIPQPPIINTSKPNNSIEPDISFKDITRGQKLSILNELGSESFVVGLTWDDQNCSNYEIDLSVFLLSESGKIEKQENFVFYNNPSSSDKAIRIEDDQALPYKLEVVNELEKLSSDISRLVYVLTIHNGDQNNQRFGSVQDLTVNIVGTPDYNTGLKFVVDGLKQETAVTLIEVYNRNGDWRVQASGEGFNSGLDAIIAQYASPNLQ